MTRANMDQKRRRQRVLIREKQERILHLKHCCEKIAADVNSQFEQLTEKLIHYKGDPNWLIECFSILFNENSATVQEHEKEITQLYTETAELKKAVHSKVEAKGNGPSSSTVQKIPRKSRTNVQQEGNSRHSGNTPADAVFGFPISVNQFGVLQNQIAELQCPEQRIERVEDDRTTGQLKTAASRTEDEGKLAGVDEPVTIPVDRKLQENSV